MLKTIQITLPQELLVKIDRTVTELDTNRSALRARHSRIHTGTMI